MGQTSRLASATTKTCSRPCQTVSAALEEGTVQITAAVALAVTVPIARSASEVLQSATVATWSEVVLVAISMATVVSCASQTGQSLMVGLSCEALFTEGSTSAAGISASTSPVATAPVLPI